MGKFTPSRYTAFALCLAGAVLGFAVLPWWSKGVYLGIAGAALSVLGVIDLIQTRHSIQRNYPVIGHIRWIVELVRPELRQYLFEADQEAAPFTRSQRSLVYERAKGLPAEQPFGTLLEVYRSGYEFIGHSTCPAAHADPESFRVTIGGELCAKPYSASLFNISAMSFGSLSANAIRALNAGARKGGFYHDTGEGSISPYHREMGGDIVWEVASGYFGCRTEDGRFDPEKFRAQATTDQVKMIEIKLSQGAKPGHGGILPAKKVSREISETRGVPMGRDCISPPRHSAFSTPLEMMGFIAQLRELSGGKPVGFKLCLGHPWELMAIVKAMLQTGVRPDFIVVDGGEGGTGAAPEEFSDHVGAPMREGLLFVHNTLVGAGLRGQIKIGAAGRIVSAFDIACVLAIGADWANAARGFMFAIGCVQSLSCHTNHCPTGVATQDPGRQKALVVTDKAERVYNFHRNTLKALADMLAAAGVERPEKLGPHHLVRRVSATEVRQFADLHTFLPARSLVDGACQDSFYRTNWDRASAESFDPVMA
ncbi:FMN-binding glutamate synthase family protein [Phenylobacterium montanum]|uniref:FMN-binding glutamate synthase family protein n=1 Tax=Phenylobacterium montanum TaxID=2823693 RepID=A0A975IVI2_9CAUL|nr:FMN-binding glutamate synthase family protein [Caulobacter sp. S6]QUD88800.1 FMN-binding glutamate synthase family protein [Caulobacter sp. S6]